jgi:hypothetical protein
MSEVRRAESPGRDGTIVEDLDAIRALDRSTRITIVRTIRRT